MKVLLTGAAGLIGMPWRPCWPGAATMLWPATITAFGRDPRAQADALMERPRLEELIVEEGNRRDCRSSFRRPRSSAGRSPRQC